MPLLLSNWSPKKPYLVTLFASNVYKQKRHFPFPKYFVQHRYLWSFLSKWQSATGLIVSPTSPGHPQFRLTRFQRTPASFRNGSQPWNGLHGSQPQTQLYVANTSLSRILCLGIKIWPQRESLGLEEHFFKQLCQVFSIFPLVSANPIQCHVSSKLI